MLTVGSLFSGAGLCDLGLHRAGLQHRWFCEIDPFCRRILARHWPDVPIYTDVRALDVAALPKVDILAGGFPCQDVSAAGNRAGITKTTRSGLWYEYKRIIQGIRPKYAVIENVKGLLSGGMEIVLQDLSDIGYAAEWQNLPAAAFGAPLRRERIFIVAYPDRDRPNREPLHIFAQQGNMGDDFQPGSLSNWSGLQINRTSRQAIRQAYGGAVFYRVDDGRSRWVDGTGRPKPRLISPERYKKWLPRLKALGNGITPQQAYFVARCILQAEGLEGDEKNLAQG